MSMSNLANQGNDAAAPGRSQLLTRSWNGQTIRMRNNRICLTDLCKAGETRSGNSVRFAHWFESDATQRFLQHRAAKTGRPVFSISSLVDNAEKSALIIRESQRGDAWGDKVVGMRLAAQLCVELEHMVYEWFTESVDQEAPMSLTVSEPRLPVVNVLDTVERSIGLLERLGGLDDRAEHLLRDIVLNHAARSAGGELLLPGVRMLSLQEAFQELAGATPREASELANKNGRAFKRLYREENGRDPKTHKQLVKGRTCDVCDYEWDWISSHADDLADALETLRTK